MGKGDKKTRRGKITRGSFGVLRRRKKKASAGSSLSSPARSVKPEKKSVPRASGKPKSAEIQKDPIEVSKSEATTEKSPAKNDSVKVGEKAGGKAESKSEGKETVKAETKVKETDEKGSGKKRVTAVKKKPVSKKSTAAVKDDSTSGTESSDKTE